MSGPSNVDGVSKERAFQRKRRETYPEQQTPPETDKTGKAVLQESQRSTRSDRSELYCTANLQIGGV